MEHPFAVQAFCEKYPTQSCRKALLTRTGISVDIDNHGSSLCAIFFSDIVVRRFNCFLPQLPANQSDDDDVTDVDRDEFLRALTAVRSGAGETDFTVVQKDNLREARGADSSPCVPKLLGSTRTTDPRPHGRPVECWNG